MFTKFIATIKKNNIQSFLFKEESKVKIIRTSNTIRGKNPEIKL